jgi:hypothetical protein
MALSLSIPTRWLFLSSHEFDKGLLKVADPDQSGQWIRIRNPDPGGQKLPTKVEIFFKSSCF